MRPHGNCYISYRQVYSNFQTHKCVHSVESDASRVPSIYICLSLFLNRGMGKVNYPLESQVSESKSKPTHICQTPKHDWNRSLNKNANLEATKKRVSGKQHTICRQLAAVASIAFKRLPHIYNDLKDTVETSAHILVAKTGSTSYTKNEHSGYRCDVFKYWPN